MLERFQEATVAAAFRALTKARGSHRFLIADEVGLGKTVSAKELAAKLQESLGKTLNVVYFCPNLNIAAQNLAKLQKLAPEVKEKPEDRLSLALRALPKRAEKFRVFCYTPDTSLPGWKHGRTGRKAERELIADLLHSQAPTCWLQIREIEKQHFARRDSRWFPAHRSPPPQHLVRLFVRCLRDILEIPGKHLDKALTAWLEEHGDVSELILRCRSALALAALRHTSCRPDLLILDEFHRYADLILPPTTENTTCLARERAHSLNLLTKALLGDGTSSPALLLLSATPYRLIKLDKSELPGGRYEHFGKLVEFLYGRATSQIRRVQEAIAEHHAALARRDDDALTDIHEARNRLELLLRPVIARTERATDLEGELFHRTEQRATVQSRDLQTFRHLAGAVAKGTPTLRAWTQPLWSSVPYPAETLFNYKVCDALGRGLPPVTIASSQGEAAHPFLRALLADDGTQKATIKYEDLSLPWLAPTQRWWKLGGKWRGMDEPGGAGVKGLLFSRYRGTPAAVSTWISSEVDRRSARHKSKGKLVSQTYLRSSSKTPWPLIAMFMPWPKLSTAFEPARGKDLTVLQVQKAARVEFRKWLKKSKIKLTDEKRSPRKPWQLAFDLEVQLENVSLLTSALKEFGGQKNSTSWRRNSVPANVTAEEADVLADWLLEAPGAIVARTLQRHGQSVATDSKALKSACAFSWRQLRPYLGQRYFASAVLGRRKRTASGDQYPSALRRALLDGCFESTMDEHVAVMMLIGDRKQPVEVLGDSLLSRSGFVRRRPARGRAKRVPVHVAVPYLGAERTSGRPGRSSETLRSDQLRRAFNSPFWPYVLSTTSIGQEGLDFHVWCDRVIHWDLPRDPVDFEQREGRIARYAGLGVRRSLAQVHGGGHVPSWQSPFTAIFEAAQRTKGTGLGIERWWSPPGHKPVSVTFLLSFSYGKERLQRLKTDLVRYRLALGQPDPHMFEAFIRDFQLRPEEARSLALNLSPAASQ
jgi:hypothetical protein